MCKNKGKRRRARQQRAEEERRRSEQYRRLRARRQGVKDLRRGWMRDLLFGSFVSLN